MKRMMQDFFLSLLMGMVVPGLLLNFAAAVLREAEENRKEAWAAEQTVPEAVSLSVLVRSPEGAVTEQDLDAYLVGVVLAEMPASFETEALKAQAIVARTYARRAYAAGGKHKDGSVCMVPGCCQGYTEPETYLSAGGKEGDLEKVRQAVYATSGLVLTYGGELIEATYFSCSGGRTEDAVAVWGTDYPYLQSVDSPGEEDAAHYSDTVEMGAEELARKLDVTLGPDARNWFGPVTRTAGGGVDTIQIGGKTFSGTQVRSLLGLRSAAFEMEWEGEKIRITTRGYGHRVGMSQYGADAMAAAGHDCGEILSHYYPGTETVRLEPDRKMG